MLLTYEIANPFNEVLETNFADLADLLQFVSGTNMRFMSLQQLGKPEWKPVWAGSDWETAGSVRRMNRLRYAAKYDVRYAGETVFAMWLTMAAANIDRFTDWTFIAWSMRLDAGSKRPCFSDRQRRMIAAAVREHEYGGEPAGRVLELDVVHDSGWFADRSYDDETQDAIQ